MGSLASRPKVPSTPTQVVYVPAPSTSTPTTPPPDPVDPDKAASEARAGGLLARDRSRFGTISTSFRGLLDLATNAGKRKTLLGE